MSSEQTSAPPASAANQTRPHRFFLWVIAGLVLMGLALLLDEPVAHMVDIHSSLFLQGFARWMTLLGEGWVVALLGILVPTILWILGRTRAARAVLLIAAIGLITGGAATLLRSLVGRTRPNAHVAQGVYGVRHDSHWIVGKYEFGSFPSGHTATVVGLAAAAWIINRRLGLAAAAYAALVSWSRIAQGSHHFSDVVAASIVGVAGAYIVLTRVGPLMKWVDGGLKDLWLCSHRPDSSPGTDTPSRV